MDGRSIRERRIRVEISRRGRPGRPSGGGGSFGSGATKTRTEHRARFTNLRGADWKALKDFVKAVVDPAFVDIDQSGEGSPAQFAMPTQDITRSLQVLLSSLRRRIATLWSVAWTAPASKAAL